MVVPMAARWVFLDWFLDGLGGIFRCSRKRGDIFVLSDSLVWFHSEKLWTMTYQILARWSSKLWWWFVMLEIKIPCTNLFYRGISRFQDTSPQTTTQACLIIRPKQIMSWCQMDLFRSLDSSVSLRSCDAGDLGYLQGIYRSYLSGDYNPGLLVDTTYNTGDGKPL